MLFIADEMHTLGAPNAVKVIELAFKKRLGLSATPEVYGNPDITERLLAYFRRHFKT